MAKICTNEKTSARQRWIENGLLELMQERKFEDISVTDLCQHLELSRRSFYRYFHDIEDALDSLMNRTFQEMAIANSSITLPSMEKTYEFWLQRKALLSALANSEMHSKITQYALKYADEEALKQYLPTKDLDMDLSKEMNLFVICGLTSLLISWHAEGFQKTPRQMAQISMKILSTPLLSRE